MAYRGRFAPSPTGPLHFGSLVAAAASYLDARAAGGEWLVRMEDVDKPRERPGAADAILRTLEAYGFEWDGEVARQSARSEAYGAALEELKRRGLAYPCGCSRKETGGSRYPGTCRNGLKPGRAPRAWRVRADEAPRWFEDRLFGRCEDGADGDDFIVLRADGLFAYQLAVVVDDHWQGITDVVRGADLLDSTPRQILLQRALGYATPRYLHVPVAVDARGDKLSKQTRAAPLDDANPLPSLLKALTFLGQQPPPQPAAVGEVWRWAIARWEPRAIPKERSRAL